MVTDIIAGKLHKIKAKESHYETQLEDYFHKGAVTLGPMSSLIWREDPKHLGFLLARYKFVSKLLTGKNEVLEVGCGDAIGTPIVAKVIKRVNCLDYEKNFISDNKNRLKKDYPNIHFYLQDITKKPFSRKCDGVYSLDVIEHIPPKLEPDYLENICRSVKEDGICIIGTPNIEAHRYASRGSIETHVNLKSYQDFEIILRKYFHNGFIFGMNDEVVHLGFYPMAHYLFAVGIAPKKIK